MVPQWKAKVVELENDGVNYYIKMNEAFIFYASRIGAEYDGSVTWDINPDEESLKAASVLGVNYISGIPLSVDVDYSAFMMPLGRYRCRPFIAGKRGFAFVLVKSN